MSPASMFSTRLPASVLPLLLVAALQLSSPSAGAATAASDSTTTAGQALASDSGCLACHGLVHKQVGPGFAQIAERYRADAQAPERLAGKIRSGSVGAWGRVIMPRQGQVSEAQARLLAAWVLSQPAPQ